MLALGLTRWTNYYSCRDGGNTFTPERYRLELNSATRINPERQAPSDPHAVSGVFFLNYYSTGGRYRSEHELAVRATR